MNGKKSFCDRGKVVLNMAKNSSFAKRREKNSILSSILHIYQCSSTLEYAHFVGILFLVITLCWFVYIFFVSMVTIFLHI